MIRVQAEIPVVSIALARPEKRNALTPGMLDALAEAFERVPQDARAIVLTGDGPTFCAGFDLRLCAADPSGDTMRALLQGLSRCVTAMRAARPPVVLGIHGAAVAGGCALLGGADIVVADRQTKVGYPVVKIGVSPAVSAPFLAASVPGGPARARLLDPELIGAEEALHMGLVHELAGTPEAAQARVLEIGRALAAKPGVGVAATKALCNELTAAHTDLAGAALETSLARVGTEEERVLLSALWS